MVEKSVGKSSFEEQRHFSYIKSPFFSAMLTDVFQSLQKHIVNQLVGVDELYLRSIVERLNKNAVFY
jgi:hypothetical protein